MWARTASWHLVPVPYDNVEGAVACADHITEGVGEEKGGYLGVLSRDHYSKLNYRRLGV